MPTHLPRTGALRQSVSALPLGLEEPGLLLAQTRRGLALWTWQRDPLSLDACRLLLEAQATPLAARLETLLAAPFPLDDWNTLLASNEHGLVVRHLLPRLRVPASGPAWLARTWDWLLRLGREDLPRDMLEATAWGPDLEPLRRRLLAEWAFFYAAPEQALEAAEAVGGGPFGLWRELAASTLLHAPAPASNAKDVCLLLYSWNKRDLLRATLEGLAASELLGAQVIVLDNGSEDGTGTMLDEARAWFPEGRMESVRLPVNVGAPGARNWLLALPQVREARYAAFLDDDVVLPRDWLPRLLGSALAAPWAGVVGCRIVSAAAPSCLQSADYNLLPGRYGQESFPGFPENIHLLDNAAGGLDLGLFSYSRRTLSVSGCCHLLRGDTLKTVGGFDLRLSPTQFDDLERDIRANLAGVPVLYAGDLAVAHVQHSSLAKASTAAAVGQVLGNKVKLECLYSREQIQGLAEDGLARLWEDLAAKERELSEIFGG